MENKRIANTKNKETPAMRQKIIHYGALFTNTLLILFGLFLFTQSYGQERFFALLLCLPAIFSIMTIIQGPDAEERKLMKRLRKAKLREQLKELSEFDS
jgi:hypothetical protein